MSEEFELISVPKELLENLVRRILAEYISLSTPEPTQDEEPVAWMEYTPDGKEWFLAYSRNLDAKQEPLFLHPAPRPEFVRLSEEEIMDLCRGKCVEFRWPSTAIETARAIEDALEEKNK